MGYYDREYDAARERRKRAWRRRIRRRKFFAAVVLVLMSLAVIAAISLAAYGISRFVKSRTYVDEPYDPSRSAQLTLVENVYTKAEREALASGGIINSAGNGAQESTEDMAVIGGRGLIVIDAGHGDDDPGTHNEYGDEKDINLDLAYMVMTKLEGMGYSVFMTRTDDTLIGLNERAEMANSKDGALAFVSIHQNSSDDGSSAGGVEALTYNRSGCGRLAELLCECVSEATGARNRGVVYKTAVVVTSRTQMPAAIIECGFMSNPKEAELLMDEDYRNKIADGICEAISRFTADNDDQTGSGQ